MTRATALMSTLSATLSSALLARELVEDADGLPLIQQHLVKTQAQGAGRVPFPDPGEVEAAVDDVGTDSPKKLKTALMHSIQSARLSCAAEPRGMLPRREISAVIAAASGNTDMVWSSPATKRNGKPAAATSPPLGSRSSSSLTSSPWAWIGFGSAR